MSIGGSTQKSSNRQDENYSGTTMPVIPENWQTGYDNLTSLLGNTGATADQQVGLDALKGFVTDNTIASQLQGTGAYWAARQNEGSHTLGNLAARAAAGEAGYESYAAPTSVKAQAVAAPTISADQVRARQGADFMASYQNPYTSDVVNAALGDLGESYNRNLVKSGMASAAGGALGGGRQAIREAQMADDYLRNVAGTSSNLRNQGFNTAANLGMTDASRFLQGDMANQSANLSAAGTNAANALAASQANAANALSADTFNQNLLNQRQQFDVDAAYKGDQMRLDAIKGREANLALQNNLAAENALNLVNSGNMTTEQLLALLNTGTQTFGQSAQGMKHVTGSGSQSGANAGFHIPPFG